VVRGLGLEAQRQYRARETHYQPLDKRRELDLKERSSLAGTTNRESSTTLPLQSEAYYIPSPGQRQISRLDPQAPHRVAWCRGGDEGDAQAKLLIEKPYLTAHLSLRI